MSEQKVTTIKDGVPVDEAIWKTTELNVAAYLHYKGKRIISAHKENSGKFAIIFSNPKTDEKEISCSELEIEFLNSEFVRFDNSIKTIKKIIYSKSN